MPCSYSVTSEDTADFISTYSALPEQLSAMTGIECIDFAVSYTHLTLPTIA